LVRRRELKWQARYWLDPRDRALIDCWVVHLSSLRDLESAPSPWKLADYGAALCEEIERFFKAVETELHPDRDVHKLGRVRLTRRFAGGLSF
jgi:hypothetical protein